MTIIYEDGTPNVAPESTYDVRSFRITANNLNFKSKILHAIGNKFRNLFLLTSDARNSHQIVG